LWEQLPPARRAQLAARTPTARAEGAVLSALLAHALHTWGCGIPCQTVPADALAAPFPRWETAANGKPFPAGIETPEGTVFVSFSHSNGHALVALCDRPLGADIQVWDAPAFAPDRLPRLAARITHPAETPPQTPQETARRFAAKEAVLKLFGDGLRRGMNTVNLAEFAVSFYEELPACVIAVAVSR
jgi:phosphopantetheinyl transferase